MKKILVIEDDEFLGSVIHDKLKNEGFNSIVVRDGALGLQKIEREKPDLILLDMILPTMDGYAILEAKRKNPVINRIPVIVISNSGQEVEIDKIKNLGAKDYIIKVQFSPKEVVEKVKSLLAGEDGQRDAKTAHLGQKAAKLSGIKILMIEDDEFLGDIMSRKLSKEGADFMHVLSGEDALEKIKSWTPDVITLDVVLPGMNGFDTLEQIKKSPNMKKVPVLMLSNLSQKEDVEKANKLGAKEFLVKSLYTLDEITEKIKVAIEKNIR